MGGFLYTSSGDFFSLFCYFHSDLCMKMPLLLPVLWDLLFVFFFARKGAFI